MSGSVTHFIDSDGSHIRIEESSFSYRLHSDFARVFKSPAIDHRKCTVDLTQVTQIDSAALGSLVHMLDFFTDRAEPITLKINQAIRKPLEMAKFDRIFNIV